MKRKFLLAALLVGITSTGFAQGLLDQAKSQVPATTVPKFDVSSLSSGIMSKLGPSLALTAIQKPKVLSFVTDFLKNKSSIMNLATSDKAQYISKLAGLNSGFLGKMKGILTAAQYTKLLGLKPAAASASNPISQLFY